MFPLEIEFRDKCFWIQIPEIQDTWQSHFGQQKHVSLKPKHLCMQKTIDKCVNWDNQVLTTSELS